jgi:hypothetical protein
MALAERRELKDWISIYYSGHEWNLINSFEVETFDLADLKWCKADSCILVWDTPLENKILAYSAMTGEVLMRYNPSQNAGLGIKGVYVSPNQNFTLCTLFDTQMKLYNGITLREIAAIDHVN